MASIRKFFALAYLDRNGHYFTKRTIALISEFLTLDKANLSDITNQGNDLIQRTKLKRGQLGVQSKKRDNKKSHKVNNCKCKMVMDILNTLTCHAHPI